MAKKLISQATYDTDNIQSQPNQVVNQASALKLSFDQTGIDAKTYNNTTLLVELADETANNSGSNTIGHNSTTITANNVGDALEENALAIVGVVLGQIPDNSLTNAKLETDIKVGSLASLSIYSNTDITSYLNEFQANEQWLGGQW